jgi:hypothetical protein
MPQLDKFIFSSQFFWLFLLLLGSYFLLVRYSLPALLQTLKFRKLKLERLTVSSSSLSSLLGSQAGWLEKKTTPSSTFFEGSFAHYNFIERELLPLTVAHSAPLLKFENSGFQFHSEKFQLFGLSIVPSSLIRNRLFRFLKFFGFHNLAVLPSISVWFGFPLLVSTPSRFGSVRVAVPSRFAKLFPVVVATGAAELGLFLLLLHKQTVDLYAQLQFALPTVVFSSLRMEGFVAYPIDFALRQVRRHSKHWLSNTSIY